MTIFEEYKTIDRELERIASELKEYNDPRINKLMNEILDSSWDLGLLLISKEEIR